MIQFRRCFLIIFILSFACSALYSQDRSGQIRGTVSDTTTGDPLFGANLWLDGTSLGAASDMDGNYVIAKIPPGTYTMRVRYIGYVEREFRVEVKAGEPVILNISLLSTVVEGQEVVITGQAQGQREAINQQLTANTIKNVVSSEKIRELPDASAATALSRLPGLSLMNGDQVVIRGIQAKQNLVLVNGIQLPSTDVNTRATNLGFISANMLSGIEVVKVLTPDMDANAIGGVVNLRLREAPANFHLDVLSQGSFNQQDRVWDNYRFWASASNRFFGDKLGVFLQGNADRTDQGLDQTTAAFEDYGSFPYGLEPYRMTTFTLNDQRNIVSTYGGSLILDYDLPNGKIMFQNTVSSAINDDAQQNQQIDFTTNRVIYNLNRNKYNRLLLANALQSEYNFGDIKGELTLSYSYSHRGTDLRYSDTGDNTNFANGADTLVFGLDANGRRKSYTSLRETLSHDEVLNIYINPDNYKGAKIADWAVMRDVKYTQHIYNAQLDFTIPYAFSEDFSSIFKVGGKFVRTTRKNDQDRWYRRVTESTFYDGVRNFIPGKTLSLDNPLLFTDVQNTNYTRGQYFLNGDHPFRYAFDVDRLDDFYTKARIGWPPSAFHQAGSVQNDFNGAEIFSAGYLMGTFSIGPRLTFIGGARFEHYNMDYHSTNFYVTHPVDGNGKLIDSLNSVNRNDNNLFPNAQLRYKFTDWLDLRVAYSQTISRPDFQAIMPNIFYSEGNNSQAGNPRLKPAISVNYDAFVSIYNNEIGLLTIGGFLKKMSDVFFQTSIFYQNLAAYNVSFPDSAFWRGQVTPTSPRGINPPGGSELISTYVNNPHPAYVKGLELEWQTNFWYLPQPLNSLVLNVNYTKVWSEMDYQQIRNIPVRRIDPVTGRFVTVYTSTDTIRTARLLNQGNDIVNVALGVDYKGFSGRISFNMQGNVITTVGSRPETDQFTGNIYKWDFTLKQDLPVEGLSVQFNGINIFHNVTETFRNFRRVAGTAPFDNLSGTQYSPRVFELNLRYTL